MKNEQLSKVNSYLSNIEKDVREIQSKYANKNQFEPEDIERLLSILDQIDERIANLSIDDEEENINNENE
jgi:tetrahydromethanopterin S-methyltransferase subunit G